MMNLQEYVSDLDRQSPGAVWWVDLPLAARHEITALQYGLERAGRHPVVVVRRPVLADGTESPTPVVTNLTASRSSVARLLGISDHRRASEELARRTVLGIDPVHVDRAAAPVAEWTLTGDEVDLRRLPALTQHMLDPGPYLSAAHATTTDPATGIDNTAVQRAWVRGSRELRYFPYPSSHNWANIQSWWALGEDAPVAFWIGAHPALDVGANQKLSHPESHWRAAGGVLGDAVRLTQARTVSLAVPADAELVIEGVVRRETWVAEGPFGEYAGYSGAQRPSLVVDVHAVSGRTGAWYHDYASGLPDMLVPDNMMLEGALHRALAEEIPSLDVVHVPVSGRRFHCYVRLRDPRPGEARRAIDVALRNRRVKHVVVVDDDVDVFDDAQVMWAVATRVQWTRDVVAVTGAECSTLDPSLGRGQERSDKAGIDATLVPAYRAGGVRPTAAPSLVSPAIDVDALVARVADGTDVDLDTLVEQ
jgi:2,5-furandicarboxylate decarboxylase 1